MKNSKHHGSGYARLHILSIHPGICRQDEMIVESRFSLKIWLLTFDERVVRETALLLKVIQIDTVGELQ